MTVTAIYGVRVLRRDAGAWELRLDVRKGTRFMSYWVRPVWTTATGMFDDRDEARAQRVNVLLAIQAGEPIDIFTNRWQKLNTSRFKYTGRPVLRPIAVRQKSCSSRSWPMKKQTPKAEACG